MIKLSNTVAIEKLLNEIFSLDKDANDIILTEQLNWRKTKTLTQIRQSKAIMTKTKSNHCGRTIRLSNKAKNYINEQVNKNNQQKTAKKQDN